MQNYSSVYLIFIVLDSKPEDKKFYTERWQTFPEFRELCDMQKFWTLFTAFAGTETTEL
jgi:hypothetical protein